MLLPSGPPRAIPHPGDGSPSPSWLLAARRLLANPAMLVLSLLLLGAVFRPYAGITHDARLYAMQTNHRAAPALHADDLFLRYGSQDSYSLFSWVVEPLVESLGLPPAFFVLYLAGNACWLYAAERFVTRLQGRNIAVLAALIYVAVNPLPFGGFETFHVNESFLTPRIWAIAGVLLGWERLLRGRVVQSFAIILLSMLLHPIMGFSGLCIVGLCCLMRWLRPRVFWGVVGTGTATVALILLYEPLGLAIFGHMDEQWRRYVTASNCYCVPAHWRWIDWVSVASAVAIGCLGRRFLDLSSSAKRLLDAVVLLAVVGLVIGWAAPMLPYKLLLQGQPYRALWPLQFVQVPVLFALVGRQLRGRLSAAGRRATLPTLAGFAFVTLLPWQWVTAALTAAAARCWRLARTESEAPAGGKWRRLAALTLVAALVPVVFCMAATLIDPPDLGGSHVTRLTQAIGPFFTWMAAVVLLVALTRRLPGVARFGGVAACGWLGVQLSVFLLAANTQGEFVEPDELRDVGFVETYLQRQSPERSPQREATPTVYWPGGPLAGIWFQLRCNNFYSVVQTSGNMFHRETAMEGHRRAVLAGRFEVDIRRQLLMASPRYFRQMTRRIFHRPWDSDPPTSRDLLQLSRHEEIDLIVLRRRYEGLYSATNGRLYIYDCRRLREAGTGAPEGLADGDAERSRSADCTGRSRSQPRS